MIYAFMNIIAKGTMFYYIDDERSKTGSAVRNENCFEDGVSMLPVVSERGLTIMTIQTTRKYFLSAVNRSGKETRVHAVQTGQVAMKNNFPVKKDLQ
jgi:hypothetical protein